MAITTTQSNLPSIQRLKYEDYSHSANWQQALQGLIGSLNLFMPSIYDILNGGVNYTNLTVPQIYKKIITGAAPTTFTLVNPLRIQPQAIIVGNCWTGLQSTHPAVALQVYWHVTGGTIIIDDIIGLTVGLIYNVTLVIL